MPIVSPSVPSSRGSHQPGDVLIPAAGPGSTIDHRHCTQHPGEPAVAGVVLSEGEETVLTERRLGWSSLTIFSKGHVVLGQSHQDKAEVALLLLSNTRPGLCEDAARVKGPGKQSAAAHNSNQAGTRSVNCGKLPRPPQQHNKSNPVYTRCAAWRHHCLILPGH